MRTVCVTGGCGFIGSHLVEALVEKGCTVKVLDNLSTGRKENIAHLDVELYEGDIRDPDEVVRALHGVDTIFHLAAQISVPASIEDPLTTEEINVRGTLNVLEAAKLHNVSTVVFASSAAVYGDSPECPKRLDMIPQPVSPYAITKLAGEYYVAMYQRLCGIRGVSARFFNVFGERQDPSSGYAAAVPAFISRALKGDPLTIFGDGEQTRDFIYVKDLVAYLIALAEEGEGLYNIGYGTYITINQLARTIISLCGTEASIVYTNPRPGDVRYSYADVDRITSLSVPLIGFEEGLQRTIEWFSTQEDPLHPRG
ncbi:NAD-dependent epimerase/dehydratase [Spirochaeta thermophila DSM 6578]|uniref:NAD-dependent epimerase/dehydratase n=1 Tax=Winmispira thermophila (strain ATCC 700085 / DSM 6578 / Z-1203) TaxID=869211 RepID=G0GB78_WINT7|nr:NAD-dependent epimerase/dehydratase family protein [Spirochaeta thermophila]AEJ61887.1 NAD-dependent epimerase/dehydratase [Spirochaeta thermophila DSM 6578]